MHRLATAAAALVLAGALTLPAAAGAADADRLDGVWEGGYTCGQGKTFLRLTLDGAYDGSVTGTFFFSSASWNGGQNLSVPEGEFRVAGRLSDDGTLYLNGTGWINHPQDYSMVNLDGRVYTDSRGTWFDGRVDGGACTTFGVKHK